MVELGCVFFLQDICRVEFSTGGGDLRFSPCVVRCCEKSFEGNPSFLLSGLTFQVFAVLYKEAGLVDKLKGDT